MQLTCTMRHSRTSWSQSSVDESLTGSFCPLVFVALEKSKAFFSFFLLKKVYIVLLLIVLMSECMFIFCAMW